MYTCLVCGKAWDNRAGLAGHMKSHKDVKFGRLCVRLPEELLVKFREVKDKHKTTECQIIAAFLRGLAQGDDVVNVNLAASNPMILQFMSFYSGRPRGHDNWLNEPVPMDPLSEVLRCPKLDQRDWKQFGYPGALGWCRHLKRHVTPALCLGCVHKKEVEALG